MFHPVLTCKDRVDWILLIVYNSVQSVCIFWDGVLVQNALEGKNRNASNELTWKVCTFTKFQKKKGSLKSQKYITLLVGFPCKYTPGTWYIVYIYINTFVQHLLSYFYLARRPTLTYILSVDCTWQIITLVQHQHTVQYTVYGIPRTNFHLEASAYFNFIMRIGVWFLPPAWKFGARGWPCTTHVPRPHRTRIISSSSYM